MKLTSSSTVGDVAAAVSQALGRADIVAVLTGGACATIYSDGVYQSHDLDFIIRGDVTRRSLDEAMARAGFSRQHDRYVHSVSPFYVEFPRGPLAIGGDFQIVPVTLSLRHGSAVALSATDACRDRLAAFYHWDNRQSLDAALAIARKRRIDMSRVRRWSLQEGFGDKFEEFVKLRRRRRRSGSG